MGKSSGGFPAPRFTGLASRRSRNKFSYSDPILKESYPDLFKRANALLKQWGAQISEDELSCELGKIIYPAKLLHGNEEYRDLIREVSSSALAASKAIGEVQSWLDKIDPGHLDECFEHVMILTHWRTGEAELPSFQRACETIDLAGALFREMGRGISIVTDHPGKKRTRGQPAIPFWRETLKFLYIWESLTGLPVLTAKGKLTAQRGKTEGKQPSTEFIRLCLKMIMPGITLANVCTLINRAREIKKENKLIFAPRASSST
jgi:hypothetical protein